MNDRELFLYELDGHGYTFENMTWLGNCFEDNFLNMAWEMWCASASREGFKMVPVDPTDEMASKAQEQTPHFHHGDSWYGTEEISESQAVACYKAMIEAA